jgi:hypothetical protein
MTLSKVSSTQSYKNSFVLLRQNSGKSLQFHLKLPHYDPVFLSIECDLIKNENRILKLFYNRLYDLK